MLDAHDPAAALDVGLVRGADDVVVRVDFGADAPIRGGICMTMLEQPTVDGAPAEEDALDGYSAVVVAVTRSLVRRWSTFGSRMARVAPAAAVRR